MFCFQCQETAGNTGCRFAKGVCGKPAAVSDRMDKMLYVLRGIAEGARLRGGVGALEPAERKFLLNSLFITITNVNFSEERIDEMIRKALEIRNKVRAGIPDGQTIPDILDWDPDSVSEEIPGTIGVLADENEDIRSLKQTVMYGLKGLAAYAHHAMILGKQDEAIYEFIVQSLSMMNHEHDAGEWTAQVLKTGETAVLAMKLLDEANTGRYGHPEITKVKLGVGNRPGILISGHDLLDLEMLLQQTEGAGIDVYTHGEMLPAHYYPAFRKYDHFIGNYGNSWWLQDREFDTFNGAILMTTNCITPVKDAYRDRIFTTDVVGYPGIPHITADEKGWKDFSPVIERAKKCDPPTELETGEIVGGFAHNQVLALADKVVEAVKSGAIKRFIVMAGCDGRHKSRQYFTDVAQALPDDTIILTAGCAKYRYNKLELGDIGGIPRVLDAGQCNDSYSLAVIALKLKEVFGLDDVNELPISFDIAWYEQKAVAVLLALLHLGFKGIRLGPTIPGFLSPNIVKVLVDTFDLKPVSDVQSDVEAMMRGN